MLLIKFIFLNPFTLWALRFQVNIRHKATKRSMKMVREIIYFMSVLLTLSVVFMIVSKLIEVVTGTDSTPSSISSWIFSALYAVVATFVMNKDLVNGQGIVNRYYGYRVIDVRTGAAASPLKCMLRNLTVVLLPFEFIVLQGKSGRRMGDHLFGTQLVTVEPVSPDTILTELKDIRWNSQAMAVVIIPFVAAFILFGRNIF